MNIRATLVDYVTLKRSWTLTVVSDLQQETLTLSSNQLIIEATGFITEGRQVLESDPGWYWENAPDDDFITRWGGDEDDLRTRPDPTSRSRSREEVARNGTAVSSISTASEQRSVDVSSPARNGR